ncbi:MAG TPA: hypothetical protein VL527_00725 [Dongiaceae bacterium]|nr:hypothetical protein [Dongiaceae bacterium]
MNLRLKTLGPGLTPKATPTLELELLNLAQRPPVALASLPGLAASWR